MERCGYYCHNHCICFWWKWRSVIKKKKGRIWCNHECIYCDFLMYLIGFVMSVPFGIPEFSHVFPFPFPFPIPLALRTPERCHLNDIVGECLVWPPRLHPLTHHKIISIFKQDLKIWPTNFEVKSVNIVRKWWNYVSFLSMNNT